MKKFAITLSLLLCATTAFAYVEEGGTSNINHLKSSGYSDSILKVIDTTKVHAQGATGEYEPYFADTTYGTKPLHKWYQVVQRYVDPVADDNLFGKHQASFSNGWFETSPNFVTKPSVWTKWTNQTPVEPVADRVQAAPSANGKEAL